MIQLKLKLNSDNPKTVYAVNGKTYTLKPGSNVLNLEYEDYISLAKALSIKPVENKKLDQLVENKKPAKSLKDLFKKLDHSSKEEASAEEEVKSEEPKEEVKSEEPKEEVKSEEPDNTKPEEDSAEEEVKSEEPDNAKSEASVEEVKSEESADYSTWTLKQLKAKYKEITGETCKLKKEEIISFLQEHQSNA